MDDMDSLKSIRERAATWKRRRHKPRSNASRAARDRGILLKMLDQSGEPAGADPVMSVEERGEWQRQAREKLIHTFDVSADDVEVDDDCHVSVINSDTGWVQTWIYVSGEES